MKQFAKPLLDKLVGLEMIRHLNYEVRASRWQAYHRKALARLQKKSDPIRVAFLMQRLSIWKLDSLYQAMEENSNFEPIIVICPDITLQKGEMLEKISETHAFLKNQNYRVVSTYNENSNRWLDVKTDLNPDILFLTRPYQVTIPAYSINNFQEYLTCYYPYGFMIAKNENAQFNGSFHHRLWRHYVESPIHKQIAQKVAFNRGENIVPVGSVFSEAFKDRAIKDVWKTKSRSLKRIIWAPHHRVNEDSKLMFSNFLELHDSFLKLAKKYSEKIQIAFKPHPVLRSTLCKLSDWGPERTNAYYQQWANLENGQLNEEEYVDLFLTSDAMVLDSVSFVAEYAYTNRPSIFVARDPKSIDQEFNEFGKIILAPLYRGRCIEDVENFIINVIEGRDERLPLREALLRDHLTSYNQKTATENILEDLLKAAGRSR